MKDKDKTKEQLIKELEELRQRISGLRKLETRFKQTQEEMRESEGRLRAVFNASDEIIFVKDLEGRFTQANAAFSRIFKRTLEEIIGRTDEEIFSREEAKVLREIDLEVLKRGETDTREDVLTVKGDVHIFRTTKVPLCNEAEKIIGLCGFAADITDSRRMSEELKERRMYLENIMRYLPDAVITQDAEGKVLEWNPEAERLFGYTSNEAVGKKLDDLIASPDPDKFREATGFTQQILAGKPISPVEAVRCRKDGTPVDVLLSASPIFAEDKLIGVVAVCRDITESKRLGRELKERRLYLESVISSTPDAIITADDKQRILEWNPGAERLFGYSRDEVIGKNLDNLITGSNPDALKEATSLTKQVLTEKKGVPPTRAVRYRKDGIPVDVILSGSPILLGDRLVGVIATYTDITEHKREEKIRESIYRITEAVMTTKDINELFSFIHNIIRGLMSVENCYIALYDSKTDLLSFPYYIDKYDTAPQPKRLGKGFTEYVLRTKRSLLLTPEEVSRLHKEENLEITGTIAKSWLSVPLIINDEAIGVLVVQSYTKGIEYTEEDKEVLQYVSSQIAQAIRYKHAEEKLHEQMGELQAFHRVTIGREGRIIELKHEMNKLLEKFGKEKKYKV